MEKEGSQSTIPNSQQRPCEREYHPYVIPYPKRWSNTFGGIQGYHSKCTIQEGIDKEERCAVFLDSKCYDKLHI